MLRCAAVRFCSLQMYPWAIVCLFVYVIGFPLFAIYIVFKNRELCKEDQLLRAMGLGDSRKTNPNAYEVRFVTGSSSLSLARFCVCRLPRC